MKLHPFTFATILAMASPTLYVYGQAATETTMPAKDDEKKEKPADPKEQPGTLAKMIADSPDFSTLSKALDAAGLTEQFGSKDVRTVFAPTNEAFGKLRGDTLAKLMLPENKEKLRSLLLYHVVNGNALTMALDKETKVTTANGEKVELEISEDKMEIEDVKIVNTTTTANNGVLLAIPKVLVPDSLDGFAGLDD